MKYLKTIMAMLLLFGIWSCKTEQWAAKSQAVIHMKYPEMEARNCAERFPVKVDSSSHSDTIYKMGDMSGYQKAIDSLRNALANDIPPLKSGDSCEVKVLPYITKLNALQRAYNNLIATGVPHDTVFVNKTNTITKENTAGVAAERMAKEKAIADASKKGYVNRALWIVCGVLLLLLGGCVWLISKNNKKKSDE